jgi:hypothetical protein
MARIKNAMKFGDPIMARQIPDRKTFPGAAWDKNKKSKKTSEYEFS